MPLLITQRERDTQIIIMVPMIGIPPPEDNEPVSPNKLAPPHYHFDIISTLDWVCCRKVSLLSNMSRSDAGGGVVKIIFN